MRENPRHNSESVKSGSRTVPNVATAMKHDGNRIDTDKHHNQWGDGRYGTVELPSMVARTTRLVSAQGFLRWLHTHSGAHKCSRHKSGERSKQPRDNGFFATDLVLAKAMLVPALTL